MLYCRKTLGYKGVIADNKDILLTARQRLVEWLARERRLQWNPKRWHVALTTVADVFLGYRVSRAGITPGRKLRRSTAQRVRLAVERGYEPLVRTRQSYRGLLLW